MDCYLCKEEIIFPNNWEWVGNVKCCEECVRSMANQEELFKSTFKQLDKTSANCLKCRKETKMNFNPMNKQFYCSECCYSYGEEDGSDKFFEFVQDHIIKKVGKDIFEKLNSKKLRLQKGVYSLYEEEQEFDKVNNPKHYSDTKFETIDIIKDKLSKEEFEGFLVGNVYKYITRYKKKNGIEDLRKAEWYLDYLIGEQGND